MAKRQPPLWLDMSFGEALERFAWSAPGEVKANEEAEVSKKKAAEPKPEPPLRKPPSRRRKGSSG